jgi:hypothetical protein
MLRGPWLYSSVLNPQSTPKGVCFPYSSARHTPHNWISYFYV